MKKLMTFALCFAAIGSVSAQKANVDAAKKLSGKPDKIEEARSLIQQAMQNPETAQDAQTYFIAGKIEFDAYDNQYAKRQIDPSSVDNIKMSENLINGYKNFVKALPLTAIPNEKGKTDSKTAKSILGTLKGHAADFYTGGSVFLNEGKYYPEAYESFMIYGDLPEQDFMKDQKLVIPDTLRNAAYYYAGRGAFAANELMPAAEAFRKARQTGFDDKDVFIYEISSWQTIAQRDSTMEKTAMQKIIEVAKDGDKMFGMAEPYFFINIVNSLVMEDNFDQAVAAVNERLADNADNPSLYGLRGFVYDRMGKDNESVEDYRKAISYDNADLGTLKNAAKKIFRVGANKWNAIEGGSAEERAARADVKTNYYEVAKAIAEKAKRIGGEDTGDLDYLIDAIDYNLSLAQ